MGALFVFLSCSPREAPDRGAVLKTGNMANDLLMELPEAQQAVYLGHMVDGCNGVRAFYMGIESEDNVASWSVECSDGSSYSIGIENDAAGTATVLDCRALKAVADVDCFVSFAAQANKAPRTSEQFMCAVANLPRSLREQVLRQFVQNLETFLRESGEPVPNTKEQVIRQTMRNLDKYAQSCNAAPTASTRSSLASKKPGRRDTRRLASSSPDETAAPVTVPVPRECSKLKSRLMSMASCSSLAQSTREQLWAAYDRSAASQDHVTTDEARGLATWCASSTNEVEEATAGCRSAATSSTPTTSGSAARSANDLLSPD